MTEPLPRLAILGLGTMGIGDGRHRVAGWPSPHRLESSARCRRRLFGAARYWWPVRSPMAVEDADVVITMVTDAEAVLSIARMEGCCRR